MCSRARWARHLAKGFPHSDRCQTAGLMTMEGSLFYGFRWIKWWILNKWMACIILMMHAKVRRNAWVGLMSSDLIVQIYAWPAFASENNPPKVVEIQLQSFSPPFHSIISFLFSSVWLYSDLMVWWRAEGGCYLMHQGRDGQHWDRMRFKFGRWLRMAGSVPTELFIATNFIFATTSFEVRTDSYLLEVHKMWGTGHQPHLTIFGMAMQEPVI